MSPAPSQSASSLLGGAWHPETRAFAFWAFLVLWLGQLGLALLPSWSDGTYYDYGFLVPVLLPLIFLPRWREAGTGSEEFDAALRRLGGSRLFAALLIAAVAAAGLLRLVQRADTAWRLPLHLHAFVALGVAAVLLFAVSGRRARVLWPCAVLVLLAVPLPSQAEFTLIQGLTQGVTEFALFANRMMGLPLASAGDTIFANGIPLHVSDGCSGIRSFQSGIFAGFVLGELLRLSLPSRLLLLVLSLGTAFLMNACRVIYLVQHAVARPDSDLERVHDVSGYVSLGATFALIAAAGWALGRLERAAASTPSESRQGS